MNTIHFSKMHGLGNDFVVIDAINQQINLTAEQIRFIAERKFGVGCDQLLLVEAPTQSGIDFRYRIFNSNGAEVEQCGNGARCFARFIRDQGLSNKDEIAVETNTGVIYPQIESNGEITVNMGAPNFTPNSLPFNANQQSDYIITANNSEVTIGAVSMGNPHAVCLVDNIDHAPVETIGPAITNHTQFPQGVNTGFMQIVDRNHIRLRVHERGVGETLACGTGACAAVAIGIQWDKLDNEVNVDLPGGRLLIRWQGNDSPVWMTGPATHVFEGKINL